MVLDPSPHNSTSINRYLNSIYHPTPPIARIHTAADGRMRPRPAAALLSIITIVLNIMTGQRTVAAAAVRRSTRARGGASAFLRPFSTAPLRAAPLPRGAVCMASSVAAGPKDLFQVCVYVSVQPCCSAVPKRAHARCTIQPDLQPPRITQITHTCSGWAVPQPSRRRWCSSPGWPSGRWRGATAAVSHASPSV